MLECPACRRLYPEVGGAPTQVCPHCQHEADVEPDAAEAARAAAGARSSIPADPVGALQLAARVARRTYPRLLLLTLPAVVVYFAFTFGLGRYEASLGLSVDMATWTLSERMRYAGIALPGALLWSIAVFVSWAYVAARVLDVAQGVSRVRHGFLGKALGGALVLTLTMLGVITLHWSMYTPAFLAQQPISAGTAFDRSRRFANARRAFGFTALVFFVGFVALLPFFFGGATLGGLLAASLIGWSLAPAVPLLIASFVALSTGDVELGKLQPRDVRVEAKEEVTPQRVGRTSCPSCGTPISYTPTGFPVDVVCPSCGKAGRVL